MTLMQALLLKFKPANMDVLPLYIVLLIGFPPFCGCCCVNRPARWPPRSLVYMLALAFRLEPARLSGGHLGVQSVRLAIAVRFRRMVRARRRRAAWPAAALDA